MLCSFSFRVVSALTLLFSRFDMGMNMNMDMDINEASRIIPFPGTNLRAIEFTNIVLLFDESIAALFLSYARYFT